MTPTEALRSFPFTVRPGHLETLDSYTRRTFEANGDTASLRRELEDLVPGTPWEVLLGAKVRRGLGRLVDPGLTPAHADCKTCATTLVERWACTLCTRGERVQQHPHLEDFICVRHHRWVGPGTTPEAQHRVSASHVRAHQKFRDLRRRGRMDMPLLLETLDTLARDLGKNAHEVFDVAVAIVGWVTRQDTLRRLFDPVRPYAESHAWARETLACLAGKAIPGTMRAVWMRLWPAHIALQSAFRGYAAYAVQHVHDFTLPEGITQWFPHPAALQSADEYLRCIGEREPTVTTPIAREAHCVKGHRYTEVLTSLKHAQTPCPRCARDYVISGVNDLRSVAPGIARQLHPTLNGDLCAEDITAASGRTVWWLCDEFHPFEATPSNRTLTDTGCAVCLGRVVVPGVNDFGTTHPELAAELQTKSCSTKRAHELIASDTKARDWVCAEGHEYRASVKQRVDGKSCETCEKRRTRASRHSLAVTHPEYAATWRPELNEGRDPRDYTKGSKVDVIWWCDEGAHPFEMRIEARTRGCGCPYCAGRRILPGFNDFATTHPELAVDWHPYLNRKYASEVMHGSTDKRHWRCKDGHVTEQSTVNRIKSGGCKRCPWHERPGNRTAGKLSSATSEAALPPPRVV